MRKTLITLALLATFSASNAGPAQSSETFAIVGDTVISAAEYESAVQRSARQKFYHATVTDETRQQHRREVAQELIDRELLLAESRRRGITAEADKMTAALAEYEQRYGQSAAWQQNRDAIKRELEARNVLERLETTVRNVAPPSEAETRAFYEKKPELFTEPEQLRVSLIMLKVDPSSPQSMWQAAFDEAHAIRKRVEHGADFAELARIHSTDPSSQRGGDMGYLHEGMMPDPVILEARKMKPGELSIPIRILQGVALFRLDDRKVSQLRNFVDVRERASQLWMREESARRWDEFRQTLRRATAIKIDTARYPALAESVLPSRPAH